MSRLKGTPKTGGRSKGSRNLVPEDVKHLAKLRTSRAIHVLTEIAMDIAVPALVRVAACNALLDRGWGKPAQAIDVAETGQVTHLVRWLERDDTDNAQSKLIDGVTWSDDGGALRDKR